MSPAFVPLLGLINCYGMGRKKDQVDTENVEGTPAQGTECCTRNHRHKSCRAPRVLSAGVVPNPVSLFSLLGALSPSSPPHFPFKITPRFFLLSLHPLYVLGLGVLAKIPSRKSQKPNESILGEAPSRVIPNMTCLNPLFLRCFLCWVLGNRDTNVTSFASVIFVTAL